MRLLRPAVIAGVVALLLVGGGSAFAASHYMITSSKQIKPSVRNALKGHTGPAGARGPQGPQGLTGPGGPAGPAGPVNVAKLTRATSYMSVPPGAVNGPTAFCPPGQTSVSGGYITAGAGVVFAQDSFGGSGWSVAYDNYFSSVSADVTAVAYCASSGAAVVARSASKASESPDAFTAVLAAQRAKH